jgi:hypothetical protein
MKKVVCQEQRNDDCRYQLKYQNNVQGCCSLTGEGFQKRGLLTAVRSRAQAALALSSQEPYQAARVHPNTHMVSRTVTRSTDQPGVAKTRKNENAITRTALNAATKPLYL